MGSFKAVALNQPGYYNKMSYELRKVTINHSVQLDNEDISIKNVYLSRIISPIEMNLLQKINTFCL